MEVYRPRACVFSKVSNLQPRQRFAVDSTHLQCKRGWSFGQVCEFSPTFRVHDVMRDLAQHNLKTDLDSVTGLKDIPPSSRDCLYAPGLKLSSLPGEWTRSSSTFRARRLSMISNDLKEFPGPKPFSAPDLQVLLLSNNSYLQFLACDFAQSLSNLRVLDFDRNYGIREIPDGVLGRLTSLELLDLTGCANMHTVSDEVNELQSLKILLLVDCPNLKKIPRVNELTNLTCFATTVPDLWLQNGPFRFHLPTSLRRLILSSTASSLPEKYFFDISSLSALQKLDLGVGNHVPACKCNLDHLRSLSVRIWSPSQIPCCKKFPKLEHLSVDLARDLGFDNGSLASCFSTDHFSFLKTLHLFIGASFKVEKIGIFHQSAMPKIESLSLSLTNAQAGYYRALLTSIKDLGTLTTLRLDFITSFEYEGLQAIFSHEESLPKLEYVSIKVNRPEMITSRPGGELCPPELMARVKKGNLTLHVDKGM